MKILIKTIVQVEDDKGRLYSRSIETPVAHGTQDGMGNELLTVFGRSFAESLVEALPVALVQIRNEFPS